MILMQLGLGLGGYLSLGDYNRIVARALRIAFRFVVGICVLLVALMDFDARLLLLPVLLSLLLIVLALILPPSWTLARYICNQKKYYFFRLFQCLYVYIQGHMHWVCGFIQLLGLTTVSSHADALARA